MLPMETRLLSELLPRIDESASHNLHQLSPQSAALVQLLSPGGPSLLTVWGRLGALSYLSHIQAFPIFSVSPAIGQSKQPYLLWKSPRKLFGCSPLFPSHHLVDEANPLPLSSDNYLPSPHTFYDTFHLESVYVIVTSDSDMEDINIPSPSAILDVQRPSASAAGHSNPSVSPKNSTAGQRGVAKDRSKPKQTKSRNGTVSLLFY